MNKAAMNADAPSQLGQGKGKEFCELSPRPRCAWALLYGS